MKIIVSYDAVYTRRKFMHLVMRLDGFDDTLFIQKVVETAIQQNPEWDPEETKTVREWIESERTLEEFNKRYDI